MAAIHEKVCRVHPYSWLRRYEFHNVVIRQGINGGESASYYTGIVKQVVLPLKGEKIPATVILENGQAIPINIDFTSIDFLD